MCDAPNVPYKNTMRNQKWTNIKAKQEKEKKMQPKVHHHHHHHHHEDACYKCEMKGHWSRTCHTSKHLVDLYQVSKEKGKNIEMNFTDLDGEND